MWDPGNQPNEVEISDEVRPQLVEEVVQHRLRLLGVHAKPDGLVDINDELVCRVSLHQGGKVGRRLRLLLASPWGTQAAAIVLGEVAIQRKGSQVVGFDVLEEGLGKFDGQRCCRLQRRLRGHPLLTTDERVTNDQARSVPDDRGEGVRGDIDYGQLVRRYGTGTEQAKRYNPPACIGTETIFVSGAADPAHVFTNFIERQNLTIR